jgi:chromosome segregation ATPase
MGSIQRPGSATPHITLQQTAQTEAVGIPQLAPPTPNRPASGAQQLSPVDAVGALTNQGQANNRQSLQQDSHRQLKALLDSGKFEELAALMQKMSPQELEDLPFSSQDIKKVAEGLGFSSKMNMVPFFKPYGDGEKATVQNLISHSHLNNDQKLFALKKYVGPEAVLDYVQRSGPEDLKGISETNQHMLLAVLDGESSIWNNATGGAVDEIFRRFGSENATDQVAVKVLRAAGSEQQMLQLFDKIKMFNRDDVAYLYVNSLNATELSQLSDSTKEALLNQLVDTNLSVAGFSLDLNSFKNVDEYLGMVSDKHAQAAQRLYTSLSSAAQNSASVQETVQKSDQLLAQVEALKNRLQTDISEGKVTLSALAKYRADVADLTHQVQGKPKLEAQLQNLNQILNQLETSLNQANQIQSMGIQQLDDLQGQLKTTQSRAQSLGQGIRALDQKLNQQQNQIQTLTQQIEAQYTQVVALYEQSGQQGEAYGALVEEFKQTLANGESLDKKLPRLQNLEKQIQRTLTQTQTLDGSQNRVAERLSLLTGTLETQLQDYQQKVSGFTADKNSLVEKQGQLQDIITGYQHQMNQLEQLYGQANTQYQGIANELSGPDKQLIQGQLKTAEKELTGHRQALTQLTQQNQQLSPLIENTVQKANGLILQVSQVEQKAAGQQAQLESTEQMMAATRSKIDEILPFNQELLSQVQGVIADYKSRLNTMSGDDFAKALDELKAIQDNLKETALSPADFVAQNEKLESLKTQILQMQQQLKSTQELKTQMRGSLDNLQSQKATITREINAANEAVAAAQAQQAEAEVSIANTHERISALSGTLDDYEAQLQAWENRLAALDGDNNASKDSFVQELETLRAEYQATGSGSLENARASRQKIESGFKNVESERALIAQELASIRGKIAVTEAEMNAQKNNLQGYKDTLNTQISTIESATSKARSQRESLSELNRQSRTLVQTIQQQFGGELSPDLAGNTHIAEAVNTLKSLQSQLMEDIRSGEESIETSRQHEVGTLVNIRSIVAARDAISAQISSIEAFQAEQLAPVKQASNAIHQRFESLAAREAQVKDQLNALMGRVQAGELSLEAFAAEGKALLQSTNTSAGLSQLLDTYEAVLSNQLNIESSYSALTARQADRNVFIEQYRGELSVHDGHMQALQQAFNQDSEAVKQSTLTLLENKKELLEARKSLHLQDQNYQKNLAEYEALLGKGDNLSPADQQKMGRLESQLNTTESRLMVTGESLNNQIKSLNQIKGRLNQASIQLNQELAKLKSTGEALSALQKEVFKDTDTAQALKGKLTENLADMKRLLAILENPTSLNFKENQQKIQTVKALIAKLEGQIESIDSYLGTNTTQMSAIDDLLKGVAERILAVENLRTQVSLLYGKVNETLQEAEQLLDDVNAALATTRALQEKAAAISEKIDALVHSEKRSASPNRNVNQESQDASVTPQPPGGAGNRIANQLSQQFTNLLGKRSREQAQQQEENFQKHQESLRQAVQSELSERFLSSAEQQQEMLNLEQQERIVNHLLEEVLQGNTQVNTTFNVLNTVHPSAP